MNKNRDVIVSEVGLRDGLQNITQLLSLDIKKRWIAAEAAAGVKEIEVGSFVDYRRLPQMADTADLAKFAKSIDGLSVAVLVPNVHGAKLALEVGVDKLSIPVSASESHSLRNVNRSRRQMMDELKAIRSLVDESCDDVKPLVDVSIATAFGCSIEGNVPVCDVVDLSEAAIGAGADELCLSDTTGYANPRTVRSLVQTVKSVVGNRLNSIHLHNTRGLGLANAVVAVEQGITTVDASLAGLGGCPNSPGASGNIVTEDLVFMLESMGIFTGIDLSSLCEVRKILAEEFSSHDLRGFIAQAGVPVGWNPAVVR